MDLEGYMGSVSYDLESTAVERLTYVSTYILFFFENIF